MLGDPKGFSRKPFPNDVADFFFSLKNSISLSSCLLLVSHFLQCLIWTVCFHLTVQEQSTHNKLLFIFFKNQNQNNKILILKRNGWLATTGGCRPPLLRARGGFGHHRSAGLGWPKPPLGPWGWFVYP
jgi:hypothetical protein